jgi:hypothetical protein
VLSALEIIYTLTPRDRPDHHRQEPFAAQMTVAGHTYVEREEVYAIYPDRREVIIVDQGDVIL